MYEVYLKQSAVAKAEEYFSQLAEKKLEGMGLLVGDICKHGGMYVVVGDFLTGETDSSAISVKFSRNAFSTLVSQLKNRTVVGWCHSHPAYGCFLSATDVETQRSFFPEEFHIAGVFDPAKQENADGIETMAKRFYKLRGNAYREVSFAVIK